MTNIQMYWPSVHPSSGHWMLPIRGRIRGDIVTCKLVEIKSSIVDESFQR
jgi:hypothetical protein